MVLNCLTSNFKFGQSLEGAHDAEVSARPRLSSGQLLAHFFLGRLSKRGFELSGYGRFRRRTPKFVTRVLFHYGSDPYSSMGIRSLLMKTSRGFEETDVSTIATWFRRHKLLRMDSPEPQEKS
jgi:hypothetical protein